MKTKNSRLVVQLASLLVVVEQVIFVLCNA
ncbi:hypothetical protein M0804_003158 [Polistes exclamans]|nr:hypothetical protein M0804_003158 [Polistes exclamans]